MEIKATKCLSRMKEQFNVTVLSIMIVSIFVCHCIFCAGFGIVELLVRSYGIFMLNLLKGEPKTKSMQNHIRDKCLIKIYKQKDFSVFSFPHYHYEFCKYVNF